MFLLLMRVEVSQLSKPVLDYRGFKALLLSKRKILVLGPDIILNTEINRKWLPN